MDILDEIEERESVTPQRNYSIFVLQIVAILFFVIAFLLAGGEIESILGTGPLVGAIGIAIFILGLVKKGTATTVHGGITVGIPLLVFLWIFIFEIRPSEARDVVPALIGVILLGYIPWTVILLTRNWTRGLV